MLTEYHTDFLIDSTLSTLYEEHCGFEPTNGVVPTADVAFKIAETVLVSIYGKDVIESEKPFAINLNNGIWLIKGYANSSSDSLYFHGEAYVEIRKCDGKILKIIHTK